MPIMHQSSTALIACAITVLTSTALASVPSYTLAGSYSGQSQRWDVMADGRLIGIDANGSISTQDSINSSSFTVVGSIDSALLNGFGASFISVSPDGSTIAIGDGNFGGASVHTIQTSSLSTAGNSAVSSFAVGNFQATWIDNDSLAISGADNTTFASVVTQLDIDTGNTRLLVNDLNGGSAGVAINNGYLYTGNGFTFGGPSQTGEVRAFSLADLANSTMSFESEGTTVADVLSAAPIAFDALGNMLIGGGDGSSGDQGYAAVIDSDLINAALAGGSPVTSATLELSPDPLETFHNIRFNEFTNEVLVEAGGAIYRYQVPAPASAALAFTAITVAARRRRNA